MAKQKKSIAAKAKAQAKKLANAAIRHEAALLKKKGLIYQKKSLVGAKVTRHMRAKVDALRGVLTGELTAVKLPKAARYKYQGTGVTITGKYGVVATEPGAIHRVKKGLLSVVRPLGDGYHIETITLPVNVKNYRQLKAWVDSGEPERLKDPEDYFAFRLNGFASRVALPNKVALQDYLRRYISLFGDDAEHISLSPSDSGDEHVSFELVRVWPPSAWEALYFREQEEYRASQGYVKRQAQSKERKLASSRIKHREAMAAKKPNEFSTPKQVRDYARGEKLRAKSKGKYASEKERAKNDPAFAEKLRERRRLKEKRQRQRGKRK